MPLPFLLQQLAPVLPHVDDLLYEGVIGLVLFLAVHLRATQFLGGNFILANLGQLI